LELANYEMKGEIGEDLVFGCLGIKKPALRGWRKGC
jgi:hypothetical protein